MEKLQTPLLIHTTTNDEDVNVLEVEHLIDSLKAALTTLGTDMSRISFRAAGSEEPRHVPESDIARAIYSSIEVEVRR